MTPEVEAQAFLETQINVADALLKQSIGENVMWDETEDVEVWVARSEAGETVEFRQKPGSPGALRDELIAKAESARDVLLDPKASTEQVLDAVRVAALASLAGISVSGS